MHYTNWLQRQKTDLAHDTSAQNPAKLSAQIHESLDATRGG